MLALSVYSLLSQRLLSQASNISYGVRGMYRTRVTPEDRKADYNFRDYQVTLLTNLLTELNFRAVQQFYSMPRIAETLNLHRLSEVAAEHLPKGGSPETIRNYDRLPDFIRGRVVSSIVKPNSLQVVPQLFKTLQQEANKDATLSPADRQQQRILFEHLHKTLNFEDYLRERCKGGLYADPQSALTEKQVSWVLAEKKRLQGLAPEALTSELDALKAKTVDGLSGKKLRALVEQGLTSEKTVKQVQHILKNATWPQIFASVLSTLFFYGTIANVADVRLIQPFEKKLMRERGTTRDYVRASYQATLPGLGLIALGLQNRWQFKAIQKLSYFNRFLTLLLGGVAVYAATFTGLLKHSLKQPPQPPNSVEPAEAKPMKRPSAPQFAGLA